MNIKIFTDDIEDSASYGAGRKMSRTRRRYYVSIRNQSRIRAGAPRFN